MTTRTYTRRLPALALMIASWTMSSLPAYAAVDDHDIAVDTAQEIATLVRPGSRLQVELTEGYFETGVTSQLQVRGFIVVPSGTGAGQPVRFSLATGSDGRSSQVSLIVGLDVYQRLYSPVNGRALGNWTRQIQPSREIAAPNGGEADQLYGLGKTVEAHDPERALVYYRQAADLGQIDASIRFGLLLIAQGKTAAGMPYVIKAANAGNARACYVLAIALINGDSIRKDPERGRALLAQSRDRGYAPAADALQKLGEQPASRSSQR